MSKKVEQHSLSVELESQIYVRKMVFQDSENGVIVFEGFLGELRGVSIVEGLMLQIEGTHGVLRLDITKKELEACFTPKGEEQ